jgi:predicted Zn-dependent protease
MLVLPAPLRAEVGRRVFGWDLDPTAYIGRSLILVQHVSMGPETNIGSLNVIRNLEELRLAKGASIATRNFISAHPMAAQAFRTKNRRARLVMGEWSKITVGHEIDCSDSVEIGDHAGLVGYRCQILTRSRPG